MTRRSWPGTRRRVEDLDTAVARIRNIQPTLDINCQIVRPRETIEIVVPLVHHAGKQAAHAGGRAFPHRRPVRPPHLAHEDVALPVHGHAMRAIEPGRKSRAYAAHAAADAFLDTTVAAIRHINIASRVNGYALWPIEPCVIRAGIRVLPSRPIRPPALSKICMRWLYVSAT